MELTIRSISTDEISEFTSILTEAAEWLIKTDKEMWDTSQLSEESLLENNTTNEMFIGFINNESAGAVILQNEDRIFWPNENEKDSLYIHKLSVRRKFAKKGVAVTIIKWAKERAKIQKKKYIRLDCAADRPKLCYFYENQGFVKVGEGVIDKMHIAFYEYELL